jgi:hypothetical protein
VTQEDQHERNPPFKIDDDGLPEHDANQLTWERLKTTRHSSILPINTAQLKWRITLR